MGSVRDEHRRRHGVRRGPTPGPRRRRATVATAVLGVASAAALIAVSTDPPAPDRAGPVAPTTAPLPTAGAFVPTPSPAARPSAGRTVEPSAGCVDRTLAAMPVSARAGQVLMVGLGAEDVADPSGVVGRYRVGGVFLRGRSSRSAPDVAARIRALQAAAGMVPLHVSVDQEGGRVRSLVGPGFPELPSAVDQGRLSGVALGRLATGSARSLAQVGITLNLAPVADTVPADGITLNRPIGAHQRNYDVRPERVGADVATVVTAARQAGVQSTLKHFPGLGRVHANTDTSTTATDPVADPDDPYLAPFRSGIAAGAAAVMVSLARYPRLDPDAIAAFSIPVVTGLLRGRLGFRGVVVSDDLGQAVAVRSVPPGERAVRFLRAGGDLVLTVRSGDAGAMSAALIGAAGQDAAFARRLADATRHVLASKQQAGLLHC